MRYSFQPNQPFGTSGFGPGANVMGRPIAAVEELRLLQLIERPVLSIRPVAYPSSQATFNGLGLLPPPNNPLSTETDCIGIASLLGMIFN